MRRNRLWGEGGRLVSDSPLPLLLMVLRVGVSFYIRGRLFIFFCGWGAGGLLHFYFGG